MKKILKAGILIVVLVIPAFVFLYLRTFGKNHYTLRRYYPLEDSVTGAIRMRANPSARFFEPKQDTVFHTIPSFRLLNQDSVLVTEAALRGKIHVADFFFTQCQTICPKLSSQLSRVQEVFSQNPDLKLISYSIDPEHDTPSVLRRYARDYDARPDRWTFVTGPQAAIYRLALKGYFLPVQQDTDEKGQPTETFTHSEKLVLVDKEGVIRGYYDGTDKKDVDRLILEIRVLLDIYGKQRS
jgi:protein SCO1/2